MAKVNHEFLPAAGIIENRQSPRFNHLAIGKRQIMFIPEESIPSIQTPNTDTAVAVVEPQTSVTESQHYRKKTLINTRSQAQINL